MSLFQESDKINTSGSVREVQSGGLLDMFSQAKTNYYTAGAQKMAGGFAQIVGSSINYSLLKTDLKQLETSAQNIELQAQERANILRQQFISSIGNYQFGAAQRGVSVGSGSVLSNLESSAMNVGQDVQKAKKSADLQASALRSQARILKSRGKFQHTQNVIGGLSNIGSGIMSMYTGSGVKSTGGANG
jgi:hypothetical protein